MKFGVWRLVFTVAILSIAQNSVDQSVARGASLRPIGVRLFSAIAQRSGVAHSTKRIDHRLPRRIFSGLISAALLALPATTRAGEFRMEPDAEKVIATIPKLDRPALAGLLKDDFFAVREAATRELVERGRREIKEQGVMPGWVTEAEPRPLLPVPEIPAHQRWRIKLPEATDEITLNLEQARRIEQMIERVDTYFGKHTMIGTRVRLPNNINIATVGDLLHALTKTVGHPVHTMDDVALNDIDIEPESVRREGTLFEVLSNARTRDGHRLTISTSSPATGIAVTILDVNLPYATVDGVAADLGFGNRLSVVLEPKAELYDWHVTAMRSLNPERHGEMPDLSQLKPGDSNASVTLPMPQPHRDGARASFAVTVECNFSRVRTYYVDNTEKFTLLKTHKEPLAVSDISPIPDEDGNFSLDVSVLAPPRDCYSRISCIGYDAAGRLQLPQDSSACATDLRWDFCGAPPARLEFHVPDGGRSPTARDTRTFILHDVPLIRQ